MGSEKQQGQVIRKEAMHSYGHATEILYIPVMILKGPMKSIYWLLCFNV